MLSSGNPCALVPASHQEYTQGGQDEGCDELDNVAAGDGHDASLAVVVLALWAAVRRRALRG